jgi:hypothetical protein
MNFLSHLNPVILTVICLFVFGLSYFYYKNYQTPANELKNRLVDINKRLNELATNDSDVVSPEDLGELFKDKPFRNLWREYRQSLHLMTSEDGEKSSIRATSSADIYFNKESIVDTYINADFFKHLPGILTGVGIIGTFSGLVWGLGKFNSEEASETLNLLLGEVTSAFIGSGLAILFAILITFFEKQVLNKCYQEVEELNKSLDSIYAAGVGEDYLARLVKAAESSATHAASLKDALIRDLEELMNRQTANISGSIAVALKEPLGKIGNAVENFSTGQGQAVSNLLENLIAGFMEKIDQTFGSQIQGVNEAIQKSSEAMASVQTSLTELVGKISRAGEDVADQMSKKMEESMERAAQAQERMNEQLRAFINELKELIIRQQGETKDVMDETMKKVLKELEAAIRSIQTERNEQINQDKIRTDNLTNSTKALYGGLSENVSKLIEDIKNSTIKTEQNISEIQRVSTSAISGMNDGALNMKIAADKFTNAGDSIVSVLERSKDLAQTMENASSTLQLTSSTIKDLFDGYQQSKRENEKYVLELTGLVEVARREAGVGKEIVAEMERVISTMRSAETSSTQYLEKINSVLKQSYETFNAEMIESVKQINKENNQTLTAATSTLSGVVELMAATVLKMRKDNN